MKATDGEELWTSFVGVNTLAGGEAFQLVDLHSAAKQDDTVGVIRLLKEGANIDKRDPYGYTPLHWASQKGHTHTVQALLAAGANVHVRDKWRRTPLHRAAKEGHKETVAALLDSGAEVNAQGDNNWTPLHCSSFHGQVEIVEMLLSHGADESAKDLRGRTVAAVCEMAQYDVDESARDRIRKLLESPPPRLERELGVLVAARSMLPQQQQQQQTPATISATSILDPASDDAASVKAAAAAAAALAAAAASSATTLADSAVEKHKSSHSVGASAGEANGAAGRRTLSMQSSFGEISGVFAMWDKSLAAANSGTGDEGSFGESGGDLDAGGIMEEEWTDSGNAVWNEMWSLLHVPDPDNPDNNLYSEVKILRNDLKRLRSDVGETGTGDSAGDSATTAAAAGTGHTGAIPISVDSLDGSGGSRALSGSRADAIGESVGGGGGSGSVPPSKRQKGGGRSTASPGGVYEAISSLSWSSPVVPDGAVAGVSGEEDYDVDSSGGGGGDFSEAGSARAGVGGPAELAGMDAEQLRQQVLAQNRLLEKMAKELERLKRWQNGESSETQVAPKSASSALPGMERLSLDIAAI